MGGRDPFGPNYVLRKPINDKLKKKFPIPNYWKNPINLLLYATPNQ